MIYRVKNESLSCYNLHVGDILILISKLSGSYLFLLPPRLRGIGHSGGGQRECAGGNCLYFSNFNSIEEVDDDVLYVNLYEVNV